MVRVRWVVVLEDDDGAERTGRGTDMDSLAEFLNGLAEEEWIDFECVDLEEEGDDSDDGDDEDDEPASAGDRAADEWEREHPNDFPRPRGAERPRETPENPDR